MIVPLMKQINPEPHPGATAIKVTYFRDFKCISDLTELETVYTLVPKCDIFPRHGE
jgi:hypothetical protein